ncbi:MAG: hypothetical protein U0271_02270 [Polyangiaceae bacterium]
MLQSRDMASTLRTVFGLALGLTALFGCEPALPHAAAPDAARGASLYPNITVADLEHGREVYVARCSGCHSLHPPRTRPAKTWPAEVERMSTRAKLAEDEKQAIERYLVVMAE